MYVIKYKQHGTVKYLEASASAGHKVAVIGTVRADAAHPFTDMAVAKEHRDVLIDPMYQLSNVTIQRV